mmetsp:Transcript_96262/g.189067  ORF Transcript_96262/g.189067 Transcript_96262/m.189067 type:complete len:201 (-) Transcript_96262:401-1003(-)
MACCCSERPSRRFSSKLRDRASSSRSCSRRRRVRSSSSLRAASSRASRARASRSSFSRSSRRLRSVSSWTRRSNSSWARCLASDSRCSSSRRLRSSSLIWSSSAILRLISWRRRSSRADCGRAGGVGTTPSSGVSLTTLGLAPSRSLPLAPPQLPARLAASSTAEKVGPTSRTLRLSARTCSAHSRSRRALSSSSRMRDA